MKVGTTCFATERGLGHLARSFYDAGVITDVAVLHHGHIPTHLEWYPDAVEIGAVSQLSSKSFLEWVSGLDVMLFFETPFDWDLLPRCKELGVKTALMPMYECMPAKLPYQPDWFFCSSLLDMQYYPNYSTFTPVPVDVPWRQRSKALVFIHNAGYVGLRGRRGTLEVLQAMQHVSSPLKLIVRGQDHSAMQSIIKQVPGIRQDSRVSIRLGTIPYEELWESNGDVAICAEKFNGLSLPLQESRAAGMLVMTTNRFPANSWLPEEPLIPVSTSRRARVSGRCLEFDEAIVDPRNIAKTMDDWYGKDISDYSLAGKYWAEEMSWEALKPQYVEELEKLCSV